VQIRILDKSILGEWTKYDDFLKFIYHLFGGNSLAGQTPRRIFTLDDSNDADSRNGVHLGGFVDIVSLFVGEIPPQILSRNFGA